MLMPRKRRKGSRSPSTRLNDTVNQLSDGELEDVVAILQGGRKKRKYLDLIVWHRGRQPYDPAEEKSAFQGYDLNSMRDVAFRQLGKVVAELRTGLPAEFANLALALGNAPVESLLRSRQGIAAAKAHAIKRCYLERLVKLVSLESSIVTIAYSGEERDAALQRVTRELDQAKANLVVAKEIAYYRSEYLDKVNATRTKTGELDLERIGGYLDSDFARLDVSGFPPLLMSEKSLLDEVFNSLGGNVEKACAIAEGVCECDQKSPFLSPLSRAKLLVRLNDYCIALGDRLRGGRLISQFAAFEPEKPENRDIYLVRFLVMLLDWATEGDGYLSHGTALAVYERNEDYVLASPIGGYRSRILIAMMVIYLGRHDGVNARRLFDNLYREKEQKPPLYYRLCFMICHLMILFDLKEVEELKRNSKNYREFMLEKGEIATPAIKFLTFLQKNARRYASVKLSRKVAFAYNSEVDAMIELLQFYKIQDREVNFLFYDPSIKWLTAKHV